VPEGLETAIKSMLKGERAAIDLSAVTCDYPILKGCKCGNDCVTEVAPTTEDPANGGRKYWRCGPCDLWKAWHPRHRIGMYLKYENDVVLLRFKRLRPGNVVRFVSGPKPEAWRMKRANALHDRGQIAKGAI
jgi:hypothetical protein